jgi:hypothetical protein
MCNGIKWIFVGAYLVALLLFALRALDLIALDLDYISGGILQVLGLPWTLFLESLGRIDELVGLSPAVLATLSPAINLAVLASICSTLRRRRTLSGDHDAQK